MLQVRLAAMAAMVVLVSEKVAEAFDTQKLIDALGASGPAGPAGPSGK
jgi:hypothetical protein